MDSVGTLECCTCRLTHCCHSLQQSQPRSVLTGVCTRAVFAILCGQSSIEDSVHTLRRFRTRLTSQLRPSRPAPTTVRLAGSGTSDGLGACSTELITTEPSPSEVERL